jgi:hypothetical protein
VLVNKPYVVCGSCRKLEFDRACLLLHIEQNSHTSGQFIICASVYGSHNNLLKPLYMKVNRPFVSFVSSGSPPLVGHWPKLSFASQSLDQSLLLSLGICLAKSRPFTAIGLPRQDFPILWHVQPTDKHPIVRPTLDLRSNWYHVIQLMRLTCSFG